MNATFNRGDVIKLKSGGPKMTVLECLGNDDAVDAVWFDNEGHLQRSQFVVRIVEHIDALRGVTPALVRGGY